MGEKVTTTFYTADEPFWEDSTDYKGRIVPLDIIRRMRDVAEKQRSDWVGRGVEVSDEAWGVLKRWYKRMLRAEGKEDTLDGDEEQEEADDEKEDDTPIVPDNEDGNAVEPVKPEGGDA